jgi:hypothetical protein
MLLLTNNINNTNIMNNINNSTRQTGNRHDAVPGTFSASFGVAASAYVGESFDSSFLVVSI